MIISRTPFRISFFGGGTDYPLFFREHGGATLSATIDKYCYILLHPIDPCFGYKYKAGYARIEAVDVVGQFQHPLIRETLSHMGVSESTEIDHIADLPARTGLGSSSSFTVGLLNALYAARRKQPGPGRLAEQAIHIERELVKDPGGHQDQYAAAFGGLNRIDYLADSAQVTPLSIPADDLAKLESHLLLLYLGSTRSSNSILANQDRRTGDNTPALCRIKEMVDEAEALLRSSQDLRGFGRLLDEGWKLKRSLCSQISNSTIDDAYDAAKDEGAFGGKVLGAGGGGFLMVVANPEDHARIIQRLAPLNEVPVKFSSGGTVIIFQQT